MDAGIALKPLVNVPGAQAQPAPELAPAAPSVLPPDKTVPPLVNVVPARNETRREEQRREEAPAEKVTRDAIIDPETREVVFRILDARTRQVLDQVPDRALLRQQAYARAQSVCAMMEGKNPEFAAQSATHNFNALT